MQEPIDELVGLRIVVLPWRTVFCDIARPDMFPVAAANRQPGKDELGLSFLPVGICRCSEEAGKNHDHGKLLHSSLRIAHRHSGLETLRIRQIRGNFEMDEAGDLKTEITKS
jgi:hypothetical protein